MKISLVTYGSRGDVAPFLALAIGLKANGYEVKLAAPFQFEKFVTDKGIDFVPLAGNVKSILQTEEGRALLRESNALKVLRMLNAQFYLLRYNLWKGMYTATEGTDLLVVSSIILYKMTSLAQKFNVPIVSICLNPPIVPTGKFPFMDLFPFNLKLPILNRLSYQLLLYIAWLVSKKEVFEHRQILGLSPIKDSYSKYLKAEKVPFIHAFSPTIIQRPEDWEEQHQIAGYFFDSNDNNEHFETRNKLEDWLPKGKPPVYFGFGSMPVPDPQQLVNVVAELAKEMNIRALIVAGWSEIGELENDNLLCVSEAPHEWLFPKCECIVHHGGAGTTGAAFRSGRPSVVCSFFGDQPTWGRLVEKLEVGTHLPFHKINAKRLKTAIAKATKPNSVENAKILRERIKAENGVANAILEIEKYIQMKKA